MDVVDFQPKELVEAYVTLRDQRAALSKQDALLKVKQDKVGQMVLAKLRELEQDAFTSGGFTVYPSTLTTASVDDREAFLGFVIENDLFDLMQIGAAREACETWSADHLMVVNDTAVPTPVPGVTLNRITRVNVRKAGK